jgi:hypothetical protein
MTVYSVAVLPWRRICINDNPMRTGCNNGGCTSQGPYRSGKSFLLNQLLGVGCSE